MPARRLLIALLIGLLAGVLAAALQLGQAGALYEGGGLGGPLLALELAAQDLALQARQPESYLQVVGDNQVPLTRDPRELIVLVAIDERTIAELGAYNGGYPRRYHADVIDRLLAAPPRVIGLDIGFFEATTDDALLGDAFERAQRALTRVVLAGVGLQQAGQPIGRAANGELRFSSGLQPPPTFARGADIGLANVLPDERGAIRAMPLLSYIGDTERPTFGLAMLAGYLRRPVPVDDRPSGGTLAIAGRSVPVDGATAVRINYFGPPSDPNVSGSTFRVLSFTDVLNGRVDPETWRGRIIMVGASGAAGLADDYWTPVSTNGRKMAGVEIHANVAATLLSTQFLRPLPLPLQLGLILALAVVVGVIAALVPIGRATVIAVLVVGGVLVVSLWALYAFGWLVPLASPLLGGVLAFVGISVWRIGIEQRQARALHRALASVIPPSVAQQIARNPERLKLGGERRVVSVMFTDLRGFTSFSETLDPQVLSRVMAEYLAEMTRVVFEHGGTLDKFVGDAVMALWNAPLDDADHARQACAAALAMQDALSRLNEGWAADPLLRLPPQVMRIGIHSGPASVGNLGTPRRFAYTALGDTVNLAARLEPLNDEYGSRVCVSQATLDLAGAEFLARFLDMVTVKGKRVPVAVYELLGRADDARLAARLAPVLEPYYQGMLLYQARQFDAAAEQFASVAELDPPSAVYLARCQTLHAAPPAADWDGVYVMHHK